MIDLIPYFVVFAGLALLRLILMGRAIREMNQLNAGSEFSLWTYRWQERRIWKEYNALFPSSRLRLWSYMALGLMIAWLFFGLGLVQAVHRAF